MFASAVVTVDLVSGRVLGAEGEGDAGAPAALGVARVN